MSDIDSLKFYLPALVMIAITLTEAGSPDLFIDLYPTNCDDNFTGFLSRNIINLLAVIGLLYTTVKLATITSNIWLGVMNGLMAFAITFPLAQTVLPYFINQGHDAILNITRSDVYNGTWDKYVIGAFYITLLMGLQYFAMMATYNYFIGRY